MKTYCNESRAAVFLDLENLLYSYRESGALEEGVSAVRSLLAGVERRARIVARVAVCDRSLARALAIPLSGLGVRTFCHPGGEDGADLVLLERIERELPVSCDLVVIGSGDHIFAPATRSLRLAGKRVEVVALAGFISASLYRAASEFIEFSQYGNRPAA